MEDFGKGAFSPCITEGLNEVEQSDLRKPFVRIPHVDTVIGYASCAARIHSRIRKYCRMMCANVLRTRTASSPFSITSRPPQGTMEAITETAGCGGEVLCFGSFRRRYRIQGRWSRSRKAPTLPSRLRFCCVVDADDGFVPASADFPCCIGVSILWNMGSNYPHG